MTRENTRGDLIELYRRLEHAYYPVKDGFDLWEPNRHKIANVAEAIAAITHLSEDVNPPAWLVRDGPQDPPLPIAVYPADEIVACSNGLLHVASRKLLDHTPAYFNRVAVPFDYDASAPSPHKWLTFLDQLWPDDPESVSALQQFFGYVLSGRTDQHKILLLIGPTRSGKGTIARVLGALVGKRKRCRPHPRLARYKL